MSWRPFLVVLGLVLALLGNGLLVYQEKIPQTLKEEEINLEDEPLRHMTYRVGTRRQNFAEMGLPPDMVETAAEEAAALEPFRKRFLKILDEQALEVGPVLCPKPSQLPQPYAATELLVLQQNKRRDVVDARGGNLFIFEKQSWFGDLGTVQPVYNTLEMRVGRRGDATLMGLSAILLAREEEALLSRGPWSTGLFSGGFASLRTEHPGLPALASRYLGLMHFLTELANSPDGICSG